MCVAPSCDEDLTSYDALTVATTDVIATELNNITGIKNCDANFFAATTSQKNGVFVVVVSSTLLALTAML